MLHYNKMNSVKRHKENIYLKLHSMLGKFNKSEVIFFFFLTIILILQTSLNFI